MEPCPFPGEKGEEKFLPKCVHFHVAKSSLRVKDEHYAVQRQGSQLFGTLDLDWQDTDEYAAAMGLRTSNDKSLSITMVAGLRVWVCSNLCFSGDLIALKRKHTSGLDLPHELAGGLDRYQADVMSLQGGVERLKQRTLYGNEAKHTIFDIFRKKIVPIRFFHPVTEAYDQARQDTLITAWWMNNALTTHIKTLPPAPAFRATVRLGQFFSLN